MALPNLLFIYEEKEGESTYYIAGKNAFDVATLEKERIVGIYKLEKLTRVNAVPRVTDYKGRKKK